MPHHKKNHKASDEMNDEKELPVVGSEAASPIPSMPEELQGSMEGQPQQFNEGNEGGGSAEITGRSQLENMPPPPSPVLPSSSTRKSVGEQEEPSPPRIEGGLADSSSPIANEKYTTQRDHNNVKETTRTTANLGNYDNDSTTDNKSENVAIARLPQEQTQDDELIVRDGETKEAESTSQEEEGVMHSSPPQDFSDLEDEIVVPNPPPPDNDRSVDDNSDSSRSLYLDQDDEVVPTMGLLNEDTTKAGMDQSTQAPSKENDVNAATTGSNVYNRTSKEPSSADTASTAQRAATQSSETAAAHNNYTMALDRLEVTKFSLPTLTMVPTSSSTASVYQLGGDDDAAATTNIYTTESMELIASTGSNRPGQATEKVSSSTQKSKETLDGTAIISAILPLHHSDPKLAKPPGTPETKGTTLDDSLTDDPPRRRQRTLLWGIVIFAIVLCIGIVIGVVVGGGGNDDGDDGDTTPPTDAVTTTVAATVPTSTPPTTTSTTSSGGGLASFQNTEQLYLAVDTFLTGEPSLVEVLMDTFGRPMGRWNVSRITNMHQLFSISRNPLVASFNEDLSLWDVSRVTDMSAMFLGAAAFAPSDMLDWDVTNLQNMSHMFGMATSFNGDISQWNVSRVADLSSVFESATAFETDVCPWGLLLPSETFSKGGVTRAFVNTNCPSQLDPVGNNTPPGPFCFACDVEVIP